MPMSAIDTSTTTSLLNLNHQPLPETQAPTDGVSRKDDETRNDNSVAPQEQEPRALSSDDGDPHDLNPRVRYVKSEIDDNGDRHEKPGERSSTTVDRSYEDSGIAFVVKETWNKNKTRDRTDVIVKGQELRKIMYDVLGKQLEHDQKTDWQAQEQTIDEPATEVLWYWNELCSAASSNEATEPGREDLQLLLDHLSEIYPEDVKLARSISSMTRVLAKDLWCLFRPGTLVVSKPFQEEPQTELIQEYYSFRLRNTEVDTEEMTITELSCYPVQYYQNSDGPSDPKAVEALKSHLIARGRKFRDLCRNSQPARQHTYDGELLTDDCGSYLLEHSIVSIDGRATSWKLIAERNAEKVSPQEAYGKDSLDESKDDTSTPSGVCAVGSLRPMDAACKCRLCFDQSSNCTQWMRRFATKDTGHDSADEDRNYLLLPARLLGYCLNAKVWAQFHVNRIGGIETVDVDQMMQKLIFDEESEGVKEDLKILIEQHGATESDLIVDPVKGKGAGLVILLHGPPGVGKTLTAETLAKCAGKPLYVVGESDIGFDPKVAEATLGRIFELAERWGAVVLK
ncbi:MAG: hypothetical protein Q9211_005468 [Gyalolechia sp. 1 TL-2023]